MKLKNIIDNYYGEIYELNRCVDSPSMYGAMLYEGNLKLLKSAILEREVFRIFSGYESGYETRIIVL